MPYPHGKAAPGKHQGSPWQSRRSAGLSLIGSITLALRWRSHKAARPRPGFILQPRAEGKIIMPIIYNLQSVLSTTGTVTVMDIDGDIRRTTELPTTAAGTGLCQG